ncbi:MAG: hypothetical protein ACTHN7_12025 [Solirubrobacterales bacterium]
MILVGGVIAVPTAYAEGHSFDAAEVPGYAASFRLEGTNGYAIAISAYSSSPTEEGRIFISAARKGSSASYSAPVRMTATTINADLGSLGKVDLHLDPSGRQRTIPIKCSKGDTFTYEPGIYEGILEFKGEEGYTTVSETRLPLRPQVTSVCGGFRGLGEASGSGIPGARMRGISYAHGRVLSFQVNKNRPGAPTVYEASLRERHDGILIGREVWGVTSAAAFRFQSDLQAAVLSPPPPFSGSASLSRSRNSVNPFWTGNLALDFPGRSHVPLAGPSVHVSLVHARFRCDGGRSVAISARPRCGLHR